MLEWSPPSPKANSYLKNFLQSCNEFQELDQLLDQKVAELEFLSEKFEGFVVLMVTRRYWNIKNPPNPAPPPRAPPTHRTMAEAFCRIDRITSLPAEIENLKNAKYDKYCEKADWLGMIKLQLDSEVMSVENYTEFLTAHEILDKEYPICLDECMCSNDRVLIQNFVLEEEFTRTLIF